MPTIDIGKISPEISEKYSIKDNTFILPVKTDWKDKIDVEVGNSKNLTDFEPCLKISRWEEIDLEIRLKETETGEAQVSTLTDKVIWEKGNLTAHFYPILEGEGGYEFEVILKEKPLTNKIEFTLNTKGVDFFYQPPLTQEYQNGYSEQFKKEIVVTETQVKDLDGNVLVERPENVVGSYVFYHKTKGGMVDSYGKAYGTGQAGIMYRPHLTDAEGKEAWGIYHIDIKNGTYAVEIPQEFLDKAVYPVIVDPTFGYTTKGGSDLGFALNTLSGQVGTPSLSGSVDKISAWIKSSVFGRAAKCIIVDSSKVIVSDGITPSQALPDAYPDPAQDWAYSTKPSVTGSSAYYVSFVSNQTGYIAYTSAGTNEELYDSSNNYTTPTDPTDGSLYSNYRLSIYATYTAGGAGMTNLKTYNTNAFANIKSINTNLIANVKTLNTNA